MYAAGARFRHIFQILMMPLYLISGVIMLYPLSPCPIATGCCEPAGAWSWNWCGWAFFSNYHTLDVSFSYLYAWVLGSITLGMVLYRGLETRLVMQ